MVFLFFQRRRGRIAALTVLAAISIVAGGATPVADLMPPPAGTFIVMQPAIMTMGASKTYTVQTVVKSDVPGGTAPETSRRVFRIDVLEVDKKRLVLGYTILSYEGAAFPQLAQAMVGRRLDYEASPGGYPIRLTNWPARRSEIVKTLQANNAGDVADQLLAVPDARVVEVVVPDLGMIGSMQSWFGMASARVDDEPRVLGPGARLLSYKEVVGFGADCTFAIRRVTEIDPKSEYALKSKAVERLETLAYGSMVDGWVTSLEETARRVRDGHSELVSKKVTVEQPGSCQSGPLSTFSPQP